ncbi:MAG: Spy/CpxP family protein refolding chaperone [Burkholderiaceae bacterium]
MKPWIKRTLLGAIGVTVLAGGLAACGARGYHGNWSPERVAEMRAKAVERVGRKLELNEVQKQKLDRLSQELIALRSAVRGQGAGPREDFAALIGGERFDRAGAEALLQQKSRVMQDGAPKVIAAAADFFDALDAAQQQQIRDWLQRRGGRGGPGAAGRHAG